MVLLHGFLYDVHSYDEARERLAAAGRRVIVPYLRGYGPMRFLKADTPRVGQQAALGLNLLALLDACTSHARPWQATIGAVEPLAWSRRSGPSG